MEKIISILILIYSGFSFSQSSEIRLKTGAEVLYSFEAVTNVSSRNKEIRSFYLSRSDKLPQFGRLGEITSVGLASTWGMSALFCESMIHRDSEKSAEQRWVHQSVDFTAPVDHALNLSVRNDVFHDYAGLFWQRLPLPSELALSEEFFQSALEDISASKHPTKDMLLLLCSSYASSFSSIIAY